MPNLIDPEKWMPPVSPAKIAGIDEAGRGCLAGPVVAAAVILRENFNLPGLKDSKLLSPKQRETLEPQIKNSAAAWSLGVVWPRRIEKINILRASLEAMSSAASNLKIAPEFLYIDGLFTIDDAMLLKTWRKQNILPKQKAIVRGDTLAPVISAASILAKTFRDRLMNKFASRWPVYGFEKHKGYGTKEHLEALRRFGPCPIHRLTFRGVLPDSSPRLIEDDA